MNTTIVRAGSGSQLTAWPSAIQCTPLTPTFLRLGLGLRLRLGLGLRPVLPRLRSDGDSIDGSRGIASGSVVTVPTHQITRNSMGALSFASHCSGPLLNQFLKFFIPNPISFEQTI